MERNEAVRKKTEKIILIIYCLYNIFQNWTETLRPFIEWQFEHITLAHILLLRCVSSFFALVGSYLLTYSTEKYGCRTTAIISTIAIGVYQMASARLNTYNSAILLQIFQVFNNIPLILFTLIGHSFGQHSDRERARFIMKLNIPHSIALVVGPLLSVQALYISTSGFRRSQHVCGVASIVLTLPVILRISSDIDESYQRKDQGNTFQEYLNILRNTNVRWSLLFLCLVECTHIMYEMVIRIQLASIALFFATDMSVLVLTLGILTLITNLFLLPYFQKSFGPLRSTQLSLVVLIISYFFLAIFNKKEKKFAPLYFGMAFQIVTVSVAKGQLVSQIFGEVTHRSIPKAAALYRMMQLLFGVFSPVLPMMIAKSDGNYATISIFCSTIIFIVIILMHYYGGFMRNNLQLLPSRITVEKAS